MFNSVTFYNRNHNGDVFESREFIKALMRIIPSPEFYYAHNNSERLLIDIDNVRHIKDYSWDERTEQYSLMNESDGKLFINTWIGNGKYGCTVENNYDMYNEVLARLGLGKLPGSPVDYLPKIDYKRFYTSGVDKLYNSYKGETVYIDNGSVLSMQADNFDFTPIVIRLANEHPSILFVTSQPISKDFGNLVSSAEVIRSDFDNDLMENSYLSRFCKLIVGRNSGPFVFSCTDENLFNRDKTFISFCYEQRVATFHINQPVLSKQIWSGATKEENVYRIINNEI